MKKRLFILTILFINLVYNINAQVITIIDSNLVPNGPHTQNNEQNELELDFNSDGTVDFVIQTSSTPNSFGIVVGSHNNNEIVRPGYNDVTVFDSLDVIGPTTPGWYNTTGNLDPWGAFEGARLASIYWGVNPGTGNFKNTTNKYMGVRFFSGGDTYYGYIKVSINITHPGYVQIHEIGYNSNPNTEVTIQSSPLNIEEKELHNVNIYPNPSNGIFNIDIEDQSENYKIQVLSYEGKIVQEFNTNEFTVLDLSKKVVGIYFVKIISEDGVSSLRKIILE